MSRWTTKLLMMLVLAAATGAGEPASKPSSRAYFEEGRKLAEGHDHAEAIEKYAQSLALDPRQAEVHAYKAASHLALAQFDPAKREINLALQLDENDFRYPEIAGQIEISQGRIEKGKEWFTKAMKLSPKSAGTIYMDLAGALAGRNDAGLAGDIDAALKAAANADPPSAEALFQLGQSYANAGRIEGKKFLQRYLEVSQKLPAEKQDTQKMQIAKQLIKALEILE